MLLSPISRCSGITALLVCTLAIVAAFDLQNNTSYMKIPKVDEFNTKNTTIGNYDHPSLNKEEAISDNGILLVTNATSSRETSISKGLRKARRRKIKKNRKQHKELSTTVESSLVAQNGNQTETDQKLKKKRRRKMRRRKNRKNRLRQQNRENINILEITTAKEILLPKIPKSNSTINELIRKLNENPEDNFDEFTTLQANSTNLNETRRNIANLLSPVHPIPEFTAELHNNITLHISIGNASIHVPPIKRNNRCRRKKGGCAHFCNPKGKIKCSCFKGFALAADQRTCLDIDECKTNNGGCEMECRNTLGSFECRCPNGLRLTYDLKSCSDINECLLRNGHGPCQDRCENTFGSYKCNCRDLNGTVLSDDGYSCTDINECLIGNGGCSHTCINTLGRVFCSCPEGMELSSDWNTCQDINECEDDTIKKSCRECVNTQGSYLCMDTASYQSDESMEIVTCQPLPLPQVGFISCSRDGAKKIYTKRGRQRVTNSPGTICKLICPIGYRNVGHYYIACDSFGRWKGKTDARCIRVEPPTLTCPPTQIFIMDKKSERTLIKFPPPKTNINWKYVKSFPSWAKELNRSLTKGRYDINFIARDPNSKLSASCTFKIIVHN